MDKNAYILVQSVRQCIKIKKLLSEQMECRMVPVPRHLSSDCGSCVQIPTDKLDTASAMMAGAGIEPEGTGF